MAAGGRGMSCAAQAGVDAAYRIEGLLDVNRNCLRMSVFDGPYRRHRHPYSDEPFLVACGESRIEFVDGTRHALRERQALVVPAGIVHRTRAIGRRVKVTFERQGAPAEFVDLPPHATDAAGG